MKAGDLRQLITLERHVSGEDEAGQPLDTWELAGQLWANIGNETGMGAIRSGLQGNVPASITRYSFMVRFDDCLAVGVDAAMRIVHEGLIFDVKGVVRDLQHRDRAYILTDQGGTVG